MDRGRRGWMDEGGQDGWMRVGGDWMDEGFMNEFGNYFFYEGPKD